jgi:hypothetical protein
MTAFFLWPSGVLPLPPLTDGYKISPGPAQSRFAFEQGDARQILVSTLGLDVYDIAWLMTPVQKAVFDGIVKNQLAGGTAWFALDVWVNSAYQQLVVRFVKGSIKDARSGGVWQVSSQLETYDSHAPSLTDLNAAIVALGGTPFAGTGIYVWQSDVLPPQPQNDGYQLQRPDTAVRGDFDSGAISQHSSYVNAPGTLTLSWFFTRAQKFVFDGVLARWLAKGNAPFLINVFVNDAYRQMQVRMVTGSLSCALSGDDWIVSVQIETSDPQAPSVTQLNADMRVLAPSLTSAQVTTLLGTTVNLTYPADTP